MKSNRYFLLLLLFCSFIIPAISQTTSIESDSANLDSLNGKMPPSIITDLVNRADSFEKLYKGAISIQKQDNNGKQSIEDYIRSLSTILAVSILCFGFLLVIAILFFLYKTEKRFGNFAFQIIGLIIVVSASLFLIVTGYDQDQITPVVGLFGTIVGFIFGSNLNSRGNSKFRSSQNSKDSPVET